MAAFNFTPSRITFKQAKMAIAGEGSLKELIPTGTVSRNGQKSLNLTA
jgi:hypothetical protein